MTSTGSIDILNIPLLVKKSHESAKLPVRMTNLSAGYDICSLNEVYLLPHKTQLVDSGISIRMPHDYYCEVKIRSSIGIKNIILTASIIDADYSNNIKICMHNLTDEIYKIPAGERVAQLIFHKYTQFVDVKEVDELPAISNNNRTGGFGSTN